MSKIEDEIVYTSQYIDKLYSKSTREEDLLKLLLDLYHNEVDAHYNVEQFFNSQDIKFKRRLHETNTLL